jgi:predicted TIM-barrel fold metal-dependent hydrolase
MFGTNYPMITAAKALEGIDGLGLDAEARALFSGGNAARVFGL